MVWVLTTPVNTSQKVNSTAPYSLNLECRTNTSANWDVSVKQRNCKCREGWNNKRIGQAWDRGMQTIAKIGARNSWRAHKLRRSRQEHGAGRMRDWTMTNSCTYTHSWRNKTCADWEWTCTTSSNPDPAASEVVLSSYTSRRSASFLSSIYKHYCIGEHITPV